MSWRAFFIGILGVAFIAAITPYNDFDVGNTYFTGYHFPAGVFFLLLLLTLVVNVLIKLLRRAWAFRQSELMLIWCMMLVSCTVPASGLMRYWFSLVAAPPYYATRIDWPFASKALEKAPRDLVLTKELRAVEAKDFFEGEHGGEKVRIYLGRWARPIVSWGVFIVMFYFATFFLIGVLRKQWVESERLIFPLARVPLELTEGSDDRHLLPGLVRDRAFLVGAALTLIFAGMRMAPALLGQPQGWMPSFNIQAVLSETPLQNLSIGSAYFYPLAVGIAFLVPADVALSIWFFFLFTRFELQSSYWMGLPIAGGTYSPFMAWQQAGAFIVFTLVMLWMARRHLAQVIKKALFLGGAIDDSEEPISYRVGFWGLLLSIGGMVGWYAYYRMNVLTAIALLALVFCAALIHARLVAQGGIFFTQHNWSPPAMLYSILGGHGFSPAAAVAANMQNAILIQDAREILSGHAANALRIASAIDRHRRLLFPAMMISLIVAIAVCSWSTLYVYYSVGGLGLPNNYGTVSLPKTTLQYASEMISGSMRTTQPHFGALSLGAGIMLFLTFMRARFYWWPIHALGFLIGSTWPAQNLWFPFLLGWLTKVVILKFCGGGTLRGARRFFMGVIIGESFAIGVSTLLGLVARVKLGFIFLPG